MCEWVSVFRHPRNQRERPLIFTSHEILVFKTLNWFKCEWVSTFQHPGNQRARLLVFASHEIPV
jgi:hypothetical protein